MGTLLLHFQQLRNGLPSLNVAVPALKMIHVKDVQKVQHHQKSLKRVHDMVLDDRRMKVCEIAEIIGISKEHVGYTLHEELDMKKLCARWVLRLLTADQKHSRIKISEQCLEHFNRNKTDFVLRFITMDETWIHHYTPESKQQSKQWTEAGCSVQKKTRLISSAGKVMASVFWDAEGILFIDYLEKGKTITREYYSNLLAKLDGKIREKRPGLQKKKSSFIRTMHLPTKVF
jgi:histone-lysine N-methyltransferase SETMAR